MIVKLIQNLEIKMESQINSLETKIEKMQERFNKELEEIKESQYKMNNAINEIKNTLEATNSRITKAEDRISELEDRMVEINESERIKEKRIKRNEDNLRDLQDNIKRYNIRIIGVPEEEDKKKDHEKILEEIIVENFPKMGKEIITQVPETQKVPNRINQRRNTPRHISIKLTKIKHKEKILKAASEKQQITHKGIPIKITADLSIESLQARREWQDILKMMKENNLQPRLLYPARISFKYEGEIKSFTDKQKLREFSTTKPGLQQMLKDILYFCFIDYAEAFDCVDHNKLWKILQQMGIPGHLTCLLRNLYADQEATVRTGHETTDWFQIGKGVRQGCILSPCLFNLCAEYIMRNAGLEEAQAGIKIARRNINNLTYADDTTLVAESEEELKSLLIKVKEESEKVGLKLNIQKTNITASGPITSWQIDGETVETVSDLIFWAPESLQMVTAAMKLKDAYSLEEKRSEERRVGKEC